MLAALRAAIAFVLILGSATATLAGPSGAPPQKDLGLTESVESRLLQFELRVTRRGVPVPGITSSSLEIELDGKPVRSFTVDDMCADPPVMSPGAPAPRQGSFVLYFDDPELTVEGRLRAVEVARLVASALLSHGHEILVLRNGSALRTEARWTRDGAEVAAALDRIAADPGNLDSLRAAADERTIQDLLERAQRLVQASDRNKQSSYDDFNSATVNGKTPSSGGGSMARSGAGTGGGGYPGPDAWVAGNNAMTYRAMGNQEIVAVLSQLNDLVSHELQRSARDIERLRAAVGFLALRATPKGIVYFADTLRRDPGSAVQRVLESNSSLTMRDRDSYVPGAHGDKALYLVGDRARSGISRWNSDGALTRLVRDASTYGTRFYAVEGRGLLSPSDWVRTSQDTIAGLALETGGLYFINGVAAPRVAAGIDADQSCWYLVSFDPAGWDKDRTLDLTVVGKQPGLRITTRSSLVIPSRATIAQTRLLAAHFGDSSLEGEPMSVSIYPIGGTKKRLEVLAQARLPEIRESNGHEMKWDVGFDVLSDGAVVDRRSDRVQWRGKRQPPVYQATLSVPAGPYEIVAVAREVTTDSIRQGRLNGTWPASSADFVMLSQPAIAQPRRGGLVVDGTVRSSGVVVRDDVYPVDPREPVAIVTAACVEVSADSVLRAERRLEGKITVSFAPMVLSSDAGRCVQIRDLVAADSLGAGNFTYVLRVLSGDAEIASQSLPFTVSSEGEPRQREPARN